MMDQDARKSMLTPLEALSIKPQRAGGEPCPSKRRVAGSSPAGRARPYVARLCDDSTLSETAEKAKANVDAAEAFLLTKPVAGCTAALCWEMEGHGYRQPPLTRGVSKSRTRTSVNRSSATEQ